MNPSRMPRSCNRTIQRRLQSRRSPLCPRDQLRPPDQLSRHRRINPNNQPSQCKPPNLPDPLHPHRRQLIGWHTITFNHQSLLDANNVWGVDVNIHGCSIYLSLDLLRRFRTWLSLSTVLLILLLPSIKAVKRIQARLFICVIWLLRDVEWEHVRHWRFHWDIATSNLTKIARRSHV